jgi:hypothetical protein
MFEYKLYKSPLLILALTVQLLSTSIASVRAATVTLDNTKDKSSECPKSKIETPQSLDSSQESSLLPKQQSQLVKLSNTLSQDSSSNLIAQLPETTPRPLDSGCEVSGEDACEISGDGGCEVGGPPPTGGGILPAIAAAGGFPLAALAPLGILPFIGGGDDDEDPSPEPIPEPSTVFGTVISLGTLSAISRKRKFGKRRKNQKHK